MESITIMIFILVVVLVSVVLTVWAELTFGSKTLPQWLSLFDLIVFGFFAIELSVRLLCYYAAEDYNCSAFVKFWDFPGPNTPLRLSHRMRRQEFDLVAFVRKNDQQHTTIATFHVHPKSLELSMFGKFASCGQPIRATSSGMLQARTCLMDMSGLCTAFAKFADQFE